MLQRPVIKVSLARLRAAASHRPTGYYEDVLSQGKVVGETLELSPSAHARLRQKYNPIHPAENWPIWALLAALFASPQDRGLGDTLRREVGGPKTEKFKTWHEATFGLWAAPCGCGKLAEWNALYPYHPTAASADLKTTAAAPLQSAGQHPFQSRGSTT